MIFVVCTMQTTKKRFFLVGAITKDKISICSKYIKLLQVLRDRHVSQPFEMRPPTHPPASLCWKRKKKLIIINR